MGARSGENVWAPLGGTDGSGGRGAGLFLALGNRGIGQAGLWSEEVHVCRPRKVGSRSAGRFCSASRAD